MKSLGRHLRLVRQYDVPPALPWRGPPPSHRASGWSLAVGLLLATAAVVGVALVEEFARQRLGLP